MSTRPTNKATQSYFQVRFGAMLDKLNNSATIQISHEQIRQLFTYFQLKDVIIQVIGKMDIYEKLSDRYKRYYAKIYMTIIDVYMYDVLAQQHYEKIVESLARKSIGVGEVVGHLCKCLLSRIHPKENIVDYVRHLLCLFRENIYFGRVMKEIISSIDSSVIANFELDFIELVNYKLNNPSYKSKSYFIDVIHRLVICLYDKCQCYQQIIAIIIKYLTSDYWNARKLCIDVSYALLVVKQASNIVLHDCVKKLKYDKIKHVRYAYNNYEVLYKQIMKEPESVNSLVGLLPITNYFKQSRNRKMLLSSYSPGPRPAQTMRETRKKDSSTSKSIKNTARNYTFFEKADYFDHIQVNEDNRISASKSFQGNYLSNRTASACISQVIPRTEQYNSAVNFYAYLQNRQNQSQKPLQQPLQQFFAQSQSKQQYEKSCENICVTKEPNKSDRRKPILTYERNSEYVLPFKKKQEESQQYLQMRVARPDTLFPDSSVSIESQVYKINNQPAFNELIDIRQIIKNFYANIYQRLDTIELRLEVLERKGAGNSKPIKAKHRQSENEKYQPQRSSDRISPNKLNTINSRFVADKWADDYRPNDDYDDSLIESNLDEKVRKSIYRRNWNYAYTLALANNKRGILLYLLYRGIIPYDETVYQCLLLYIRKLLGNIVVLKWLKNYLIYRRLDRYKLYKLQSYLQFRQDPSNKNYDLLQKMVLNELSEQIKHAD